MKTNILLLLTAAGLALAAPARAQGTACPPAQPCSNGPRVPFPVVSPVQGLNALSNRVNPPAAQPQQTIAPVPWNYVPVATPPQNLPPELRPH